MNICDKIIHLLDSHNITYTLKHHDPTPTSEESAKARGESINIGAKALLIKTKTTFVLCVIPANRKLDTKRLRKILKTKSLRFATTDELKELTGLDKGAVPPFGHLLGLEMIVDPAQFEQEKIAFNAGSLTTSVLMKSADYRKLISAQEHPISIW